MWYSPDGFAQRLFRFDRSKQAVSMLAWLSQRSAARETNRGSRLGADNVANVNADTLSRTHQLASAIYLPSVGTDHERSKPTPITPFLPATGVADRAQCDAAIFVAALALLQLGVNCLPTPKLGGTRTVNTVPSDSVDVTEIVAP